MFDQLAQVEKRYKEIEQRLYDPAVVSRVDEYQKLMKESSELAPLVQKYQEYKAAKQQGEDALALLDWIKSCARWRKKSWRTAKQRWPLARRS